MKSINTKQKKNGKDLFEKWQGSTDWRYFS